MIRRINFTLLFLLALLVMETGSGSHYAAQPEPRHPNFVADEVIVRFKNGVNQYTKDLARFRVAGTSKKVFKTIPGLEIVKLQRGVSVQEAIALYQQDPSVLYAEPNYILKTTLIPNDSRYATGEMWGLNNFGQSGGTPDADIDAPEAWDHSTGDSNVIVAVIDSGIDYNHPDLVDNMFRNEGDCNTNGKDDDGNGYVDDCYGIDTQNNDSNPLDDNNHGTHVAGTIGAKGNNSKGVVGINWNIKLMACKFVDASGSGTTESAIDCLEYVKTMKDRGFNIIASSNSWGGGDFSQALFDAIDIHRQRGILFITAAGNGDSFGFPIDNDQTAFYPCTYYLPNIICVAATTRNDDRSSFSNYGRHTVHIGAPGSDILSTTRNGNYGFASGTSMATPHVTGVAALLKAEDPSRDWRAIKNLILAGGDNVSSMVDTITGNRLSANGSMTCNNSTVFSRLRPVGNTILGKIGEPLEFAVLHINCANGNGDIAVTLTPGNQTITLLDNGLASDQAIGDGIYTGQWTPSTEGIFNVTFPGGDVVTVGVGNPQITVTPTTVAAGGSVNTAWSGLVFPAATDWIGLYPIGAPAGWENPSLAWRYTTGTASGSVSFVIPSSTLAGTYELRLFANDGYTLLATSESITVTAPAPATLTVTPTSIGAGGAVTATWNNIASPTPKDWIGLYKPGAANSPSISWRYTTGTASGSVPFVIPANLAAGTYELRLFANDGYTLLAKSPTITVTTAAIPTLTVTPTSIAAGGTVTATWNNIASSTPKDWIGLYKPGAANSPSISWRYTTGTASGSVSFVIPANLAAGTYELRLFANNGYTLLATSSSITVTAPAPAMLTVTPTSIGAGGAVTATWNNIASPTPKDWIGLYKPGAANSPSISWRYTTGTASGSVSFVIPANLAAGTYELRLFANNGYTLLAKSNLLTVTSP